VKTGAERPKRVGEDPDLRLQAFGKAVYHDKHVALLLDVSAFRLVARRCLAVRQLAGVRLQLGPEAANSSTHPTPHS
jgi:hypothetical protein